MMDTNSQRFRDALDDHITGHWGEDVPVSRRSRDDGVSPSAPASARSGHAPGAHEEPEPKLTKKQQAAQAAQEKQEALGELRRLLALGHYTVYTILEHCSASGTTRHIKAITIIKDEPYNLSHLIAAVGIYKRVPMGKGHDGLIINGGGMDMGWDMVYNTSRIAYKDGVPKGCDAHEPGYVLRQRWL